MRKPRIEEAASKSGVDFLVLTVNFGVDRGTDHRVEWAKESRQGAPTPLANHPRMKETLRPGERPGLFETMLRIKASRERSC